MAKRLLLRNGADCCGESCCTEVDLAATQAQHLRLRAFVEGQQHSVERRWVTPVLREADELGAPLVAGTSRAGRPRYRSSRPAPRNPA